MHSKVLCYISNYLNESQLSKVSENTSKSIAFHLIHFLAQLISFMRNLLLPATVFKTLPRRVYGQDIFRLKWIDKL